MLKIFKNNWFIKKRTLLIFIIQYTISVSTKLGNLIKKSDSIKEINHCYGAGVICEKSRWKDYCCLVLQKWSSKEAQNERSKDTEKRRVYLFTSKNPRRKHFTKINRIETFPRWGYINFFNAKCKKMYKNGSVSFPASL